MSPKIFSRYCPFKQGSIYIMSVRVDITKRKASLFYNCTFFFPLIDLVVYNKEMSWKFSKGKSKVDGWVGGKYKWKRLTETQTPTTLFRGCCWN
jgi:hypothetical protein